MKKATKLTRPYDGGKVNGGACQNLANRSPLLGARIETTPPIPISNPPKYSRFRMKTENLRHLTWQFYLPEYHAPGYRFRHGAIPPVLIQRDAIADFYARMLSYCAYFCVPSARDPIRNFPFLCKFLAPGRVFYHAHILAPPPARDPRLVRVGSKTESTYSYPLALCGETPQFLFRPYCSLKKSPENIETPK